MSLDEIYTDADGCYELPFVDGCEDDDDNKLGEISNLKSEISKETATAPFTCIGTSRRRHHTIIRVIVRNDHLVEASTENPVQFKIKRSCNQSLSDSSCDESRQVDWVKCMDCVASDASFEKEVSAQSPRIQKRLKKVKRKKEEKKAKSEEIVKKSKSITKIITDPDEMDLLNWMRAIEKCTLDQLKSLCRANGLMVGGTKVEVVERVVRCKRHGSPGLCPECNFAKLKFEYPSNDDEIMALPNKVFCNNFLGPPVQYGQGDRCSFHSGMTLEDNYHNDIATARYCVPLVDSADGILMSKQLSTGSQIMSSL